MRLIFKRPPETSVPIQKLDAIIRPTRIRLITRGYATELQWAMLERAEHILALATKRGHATAEEIDRVRLIVGLRA